MGGIDGDDGTLYRPLGAIIRFLIRRSTTLRSWLLINALRAWIVQACFRSQERK
jgi:hypothetical protein